MNNQRDEQHEHGIRREDLRGTWGLASLVEAGKLGRPPKQQEPSE